MTDPITVLILSSVAALSTGVGGLGVLAWKTVPRPVLSVSLGFAAGAMVYVSLVELLPASAGAIGVGPANLAMFGGMAAFGVIDLLVPHDYIQEKSGGRLAAVGVMTAVGIAIHNIPEGMALVTTTTGDLHLGLSLAVALAIHNIPEGIAVSAPILAATGNRLKAFGTALLTGLAELFGAVAALFILRPLLTDGAIGASFGFVAGVMIAISLDELLPTCYENGRGHKSAVGVVLGMATMAASAWLMG